MFTHNLCPRVAVTSYSMATAASLRTTCPTCLELFDDPKVHADNLRKVAVTWVSSFLTAQTSNTSHIVSFSFFFVQFFVCGKLQNSPGMQSWPSWTVFAVIDCFLSFFLLQLTSCNNFGTVAQEINYKLSGQPLGGHLQKSSLSHRDEVVVNRLRIGHTRICVAVTKQYKLVLA